MVSQVQPGDALFVMVDSNARTRETNGGGGTGRGKVLGAFVRDELERNGERLLLVAKNCRRALNNTFFQAPKHSVSHLEPNLRVHEYGVSDHHVVREQVRVRGRFHRIRGKTEEPGVRVST